MELISVTICDGNCDGRILFVTEWQMHVNKKKFVTEVSKFVTENSVTI